MGIKNLQNCLIWRKTSLFSGPEAERLGALVEEHVGTVEERVSLMFCHGEESCLTRIVDDVGYDETVREDEIFRDRAGILVRGRRRFRL